MRLHRPLATATRRLCAATLVSLSALATLTALPAHAADAAPDTAFTAASTAFQRAVDGDNSAIDQALVQFTTLAQTRAGDPLTLVYAGAATSMQARTTWLPWKKMRYAEDGLAQIDKALALLTPAHDTLLHNNVPIGLETRLTAAGTFLALPSMFHRSDRGRRLLDEVMKHPAFAATPARFQEAARKIAAKVSA